MIHLDPRTKLLLLFISNFILIFHVSFIYEVLMMTIIVSLFFFSGLYKSGVKFTILYSLFVLMNVIDYSNHIVLAYIAMFANTIRLMLPVVAMGTYIFASTKVSEMSCALRRMHVSENIIIPLVVMIRFFPTAKEDFIHIKEAMTLRGIEISVFHPIQTLEYVLIPLLMNSSFVANDLTVASLTKGLSIQGEHTSIAELYLTIYDFVYPVILLVPMVLFMHGVKL